MEALRENFAAARELSAGATRAELAKMNAPLTIQYFSDVLCVWAWIAELRNQELEATWQQQVVIVPHFLDLFADTKARVGQGWAERGGYDGFAQHVRQAAEPYDSPVHSDVWSKVRPATSANAHLIIKAAQIVAGDAAASALARAIRSAFFAQAMDVGSLDVLEGIARDSGLDLAPLEVCLKNGEAIAALLSDAALKTAGRVVGSPTWILNEGRQTLYGNVGYRVLHANVEELLRRPSHEASWC